MPTRVSLNELQASTVDILNVIRQNASAEYQSMVPEVETASDIPRVGEVLVGYPAMANQFMASLVNRIALVRLQGATFNNRFAPLKKGYLEFGETVEEIFVGLIKARHFNPEKAAAREFKRTIPDVRTVFHTMNWRAQYPVTVSNVELRTAFQSEGGVRDLLERIVSSVYTSADYDEWLLFKYLLIKAISHGKVHPMPIGTGDMKEAAEKFRGTSNLLEFMSDKYNAFHVRTSTPRSKQYIFMDAQYNAAYDVEVLASAFNMDKADFMGRLILVDKWNEFDNERFDEVRRESDGIEEVTADELALMAGVKAVLVDEDWFQVYDNYTGMTDTFVSSGLYWNYFYHTFKTVSYSPFANAVVFAEGNNAVLPNSITVEVTGKTESESATVLTLAVKDDNAALAATTPVFVQTENATKSGIAVHKFGGVIFPAAGGSLTLVADMGGATYTAAAAVKPDTAVGATVILNKG